MRKIIAATLITISGIAHAGWDADFQNWSVVSEADKYQSCRSLDFNESVNRARGDKNNPLATTNVSGMIGWQMEWCEAQPEAIRHKYGSRY